MPAKHGGLALIFGVSGGSHEPLVLGAFYTAIVVDDDGREVLTLNLPVELVESAVLARCHVDVFASLSGEVTADVETAVFSDSLPERSGLDDLVERAVEPAMLQDESEARELLKSLRQKLETAIGAVDAAVSRIAPS
ncbi:MAG: hypothetical protein ACKVP5_03390 [Aestuariivirga sp.]